MPQSLFENPSASPDEIDYFTETCKFRLRHAMEEDGCGMMSSSAPSTLLTQITGEVWRELRPSMDIEPGSLVLDARSQTMVQVVQVREAQGVYHRDKYEYYYAAPAIDFETGYRYDRLLRAKLDKASSLDQSTPAPEHSTRLSHTGLAGWTIPNHTVVPTPPPYQLTDLQRTLIYPPLPRSTVGPPVPHLNEQLVVTGGNRLCFHFMLFLGLHLTPPSIYLCLPYLIQHPYLVLLPASFLLLFNHSLITIHKQSFVPPKSLFRIRCIFTKKNKRQNESFT
ncbi:hypothetical protein I309_00818 [Cryptococcus deuterogattii LA55]|nr:hypothetical protein I309_00818 [Cryptococcus deuterogattii LA55]KIR92931.1 hypothetical protein I304_03512 [Cryptococcus deuterogattii CBS 10090]